MAEDQTSQENLDLSRKLLDVVKETNAELMRKASAMRESYKQQAQENLLAKEIVKDIAKAAKNKELLKDLTKAANGETADAAELEQRRLEIEEKLFDLGVDRSLAEKAAAKAKKEDLKEETELYQNLIDDIDEATGKLEKMAAAAGEVRDKTKEIEVKKGEKAKQEEGGIIDLLPDKLQQTIKGIQNVGKVFKQEFKTDKADDAQQAASAELDKLEQITFKRGGKDQTRFRYKKGMDKGGIEGGQRFVSGEKVMALQKTAGKKLGGLGKGASQMTKFAKAIKGIGKAMKTVAKFSKVLLKAIPFLGEILMVLEGLIVADKQVTELGKQFSLSRSEAMGMREEMAATAAVSMDLYVTAENMFKANNSINQALGTGLKFNNEQLAGATKLLEKVKMTGEATGGLVGLAEIHGEMVDDAFYSSLEMVESLKAEKGIRLDNRKIMEEVGKTQGQLRAQLGGSTMAIAEAVTQAKLLGFELKNVAAAGKQLLNFEESISNELEAELLTGKQLNLEQARLAALTGDQVTLAKELARNVGSYSEFTKMNALQQDALAKATGMTTDELEKQLFTQETQNMNAAELRAMGKDELANELERTTNMEKFAQLMEKLQSVITDVLTPFLPLFDLLGAIFQIIGGILGIITPIIKLVMIPLQFVSDLISGLTNLFTGGSFNFGGTMSSIAAFGTSIGMAQGGVVKATPGGVPITAGEGGEDEVITPLSKVEQTFGGSNIDYDKMAAANNKPQQQQPMNIKVEQRNDGYSFNSSTASQGRYQQIARYNTSFA